MILFLQLIAIGVASVILFFSGVVLEHDYGIFECIKSRCRKSPMCEICGERLATHGALLVDGEKGQVCSSWNCRRYEQEMAKGAIYTNIELLGQLRKSIKKEHR